MCGAPLGEVGLSGRVEVASQVEAGVRPKPGIRIGAKEFWAYLIRFDGGGGLVTPSMESAELQANRAAFSLSQRSS